MPTIVHDRWISVLGVDPAKLRQQTAPQSPSPAATGPAQMPPAPARVDPYGNPVIGGSDPAARPGGGYRPVGGGLGEMPPTSAPPVDPARPDVSPGPAAPEPQINMAAGPDPATDATSRPSASGGQTGTAAPPVPPAPDTGGLGPASPQGGGVIGGSGGVGQMPPSYGSPPVDPAPNPGAPPPGGVDPTSPTSEVPPVDAAAAAGPADGSASQAAGQSPPAAPPPLTDQQLRQLQALQIKGSDGAPVQPGFAAPGADTVTPAPPPTDPPAPSAGAPAPEAESGFAAPGA
jgi:hypothetical protein